MLGEGSLCLYTCPTHIWGVGRVLQCHDGVEVVDLGGDVVRVDVEEVLQVGEEVLQVRSDLLEVPTPHEGVVLHWLRRRFDEGKYATRLGRVMLQFRSDHEPTCSTASEVYSRMLHSGAPQTLCVKGETHSDKHIFALSSLKSLLRCGGASRHVQETLHAAVGLLHFFGAARTLQGAETPCFSCVWRLGYSQSGALSSISLSTAALESSRILSVTENERLFTAAYLLLAGSDASKYLATSAVFPQIVEGVAPDAQDKVDYERAVALCHVLGFDTRTRDSLWRLVSAALHVGSLELVHAYSPTATTVKVSHESQSSLKLASGLLGVDPSSLAAHITSSAHPAVTRDAIACAIYTSLFDRVVALLNNTLDRHLQGHGAHTHISVVDCAGSQVHSTGPLGVEELLRHAICEVVEGKYRCDIIDVPRAEAELLSDAGCDAVVGLPAFEGPPPCEVNTMLFASDGLLDRLDAASDDAAFYDSITTLHSPLVGTDDPDGTLLDIHHTFGVVTYDVCGFVHANAPLARSVAELLAASQPLGGLCRETSAHTSRTFLRIVSEALQCDTAWVCCVSPDLLFNQWNGSAVAAQLQRNGVMGILHFTRHSHDVCLTQSEFVRRYSILSGGDTAAAVAQELNALAVSRGLAVHNPLRIIRGSVLGVSTVLRTFDMLVQRKASAVLIGFARSFIAHSMCTEANPREHVKASMVDLRKLARVELSERQLILRDERKYRTFSFEQFNRRGVSIFERVRQSREDAQCRRLKGLEEVEGKRRKSIVAQSDIWFRQRRDESLKVTSRWFPKKGPPSSVVSSEPVAQIDAQAEEVAARLIQQQKNTAALVKSSDLTVSERRARAMEEAVRRGAHAQKQLKRESHRKVLDAQRHEKEARAEKVKQQTEAQRRRLLHEKALQAERKTCRREQREVKARREEELRQEEQQWDTFQHDLMKNVEQRLDHERRHAQERLSMERQQEKVLRKAQFTKVEQMVEVSRMHKEWEDQATEQITAQQRKKCQEVMYQENARQREKLLKREKLEKQRQKLDWERRQLAAMSFQAAVAHPHLYDPDTHESPIRGRRTAQNEWVPLSQRMGLAPATMSPRFHGKTSQSPVRRAPTPQRKASLPPEARQRSASRQRSSSRPGI